MYSCESTEGSRSWFGWLVSRLSGDLGGPGFTLNDEMVGWIDENKDVEASVVTA